MVLFYIYKINIRTLQTLSYLFLISWLLIFTSSSRSIYFIHLLFIYLSMCTFRQRNERSIDWPSSAHSGAVTWLSLPPLLRLDRRLAQIICIYPWESFIIWKVLLKSQSRFQNTNRKASAINIEVKVRYAGSGLRYKPREEKRRTNRWAADESAAALRSRFSDASLQSPPLSICPLDLQAKHDGKLEIFLVSAWSSADGGLRDWEHISICFVEV